VCFSWRLLLGRIRVSFLDLPGECDILRIVPSSAQKEAKMRSVQPLVVCACVTRGCIESIIEDVHDMGRVESEPLLPHHGTNFPDFPLCASLI